ncbi:MAG TPA: hypothetical protein VD931_09490 [Baekduia sp.]|nr:hypothetical protein [Baekduia sp.]
MRTTRGIRRAIGLATLAAAVAAPVAQAQVDAEVDAGAAQVSSTGAGTGVQAGDQARAGTAGGGTAARVPGVAGANVAHNDLTVGAADLAHVGLTDQLALRLGGTGVVLDDRLVGVERGSTKAGVDIRRGKRSVRVKVPLGDTVAPVGAQSRRTAARTCKTLKRQQRRGIHLNGQQLRLLGACGR